MGLRVEPPQTNMLYVDIPAPKTADVKKHLERRGILATVSTRTRLVTHLDLTRAKIDTVLQAFRDFPHWES